MVNCIDMLTALKDEVSGWIEEEKKNRAYGTHDSIVRREAYSDCLNIINEAIEKYINTNGS